MTDGIAVFANDLGASFINKHLVDLSPGTTVAVGTYGQIPALAHLWPVSCPTFLTDRWRSRLDVRLALRAGFSLSALRDRAVERFLRQHRITVVLGEFLDQFLEFVPLMNRIGLPYVIQGHGIDVSARLCEPGIREAYLGYRSARAVLTRSELHRRRLITLGLSEDKVHVNHGGVDVPAKPPARDAAASKRFLAIGVMVAKKAPIYLLEAFRHAAAKDPDLSLDYVGGGSLFPAAAQFVAACKLQERVRLHGIVSEETKQQLLRECGVFVQHSMTVPETGDEEGLPAAIQEAMANGMAVVSTRHAGIPEAVIDGETGLLTAEGDVAAMAESFLRIPALAEKMGRAGHQEALAKHAWRYERDRLRYWLFEAA
jgi:glycosyltransferase involved in cell wall biosynthesis